MIEETNQSLLIKVILLASSSMTIMANTTVAPSLVQMEKIFIDVPQHELLVRLVLTIPSLFIALTAFGIGSIVDKWGRKPVVIASFLLYGIAGSSGFYLDSLYHILIGRAALGIAVGGVMTSITTLISDYFKGPQMDKMIGLQASVMGFGGVVFLFFGGILADIHWRSPFLIYLLPFFILPFAIYYLYEPKIETDNEIEKTSVKVEANSKVIMIYILAFLSMITFYIIPVHLPFFLESINHQISNTETGLALSTWTFFAASVSLQYGRIKQKFHYQFIFMLIFLLMGTGFFIVMLSVKYYQILFGMAIGGAGMGMLIPNMVVWLVQLVPVETKGKAVGLLSTAIFFGQFCSPIFSQPIIDTVTLRYSFGVIGGIMVLIAVPFFYIIDYCTNFPE